MNFSNKHLANIFGLTFFVVTLLILLNSIIYFPSIGGFFLADDFIHIAYLHKVFQGHPWLLLTNFYTNWMQAVATQFYRPLISFSLAVDYLFWGSNAVGYHLSNLFFQISSAILFYFLICRMVNILGPAQARKVAIVSAICFSVYPLHPEVVSWVIGRVDSLATTFYLASFWLFLKYEQEGIYRSSKFRWLCLCLSLIFYLASLLSKEIAVTLPLAIFLWLVMFREDKHNFKATIIRAVKSTFPFWIVLVCYLAIRSNALGTLYGGYSGSLGDALNINLIKRFSMPQLLRLVFPFNDELFLPKNVLRLTLKILYGLAAGLLLARLFCKRFYWIPGKLICYAIMWFFISILPAYQVFDLMPNLQGSRIIYLASLPICLILALLLLPLSKSFEAADDDKQRGFLLITVSSYTICLAILFVFALTTYINNLPWRYAGDELREFQTALVRENAKIGPNKKLILLNLPTEYKGAHMLYNAGMLSTLLSPPLCSNDLSHSIITFEPILYGQSELLNYARLMRLMSDANHYAVIVWQENPVSHHGHLQVVEIDAYAKFMDTALNLKVPSLRFIDASKFEFLASPQVDIPTDKYGLIELTIEAKNWEGHSNSKEGWLRTEWLSIDKKSLSKCGSVAQPLTLDGKVHKVLVNLSEYKSWFLAQRINQLRVYAVSDKCQFRVRDMHLLNTASFIPQLSLHPNLIGDEDETGVCHIRQIDNLCFRYDASQIKNARAVIYEISKPNFWFEHEQATFNSNKFSPNAVLRKRIEQLKGEIIFSAANLNPGYCEIHLAAVDKQGNILGLMSYPLCIQIDGTGR